MASDWKGEKVADVRWKKNRFAHECNAYGYHMVILEEPEKTFAEYRVWLNDESLTMIAGGRVHAYAKVRSPVVTAKRLAEAAAREYAGVKS